MTEASKAPEGANPKLGRYEILGEIGTGGMGVVYRALDPTIGRTVAVKTVHLSEQGSQEEIQALRARLVRESQAAGQLSHPNIVPIYDFGEQQDVAYIVMEYVAGRTLEAALASDPEIRSLPVALRILADCARALDYAHTKGVIHRDVKPSNIILQPDGTLKIADFGIAKVLQGSTLTMTSVLVGSPHYMAPEQLKGQPVSGRADQYALATLAFAMITGRRPFEADSMATLVTRTLFEEPPPVPSLNPALGLEVDSVLRKALAKDPAARYDTCTAFVEALQSACIPPAVPASGTYATTGSGSFAPAALPSGSFQTAGAPSQQVAALPEPKRTGRLWIPLVIGLVLLLAAAAAAGVYLSRQNEAQRVELEYWQSVQNSRNPDLLAAYIQRYPNGQFVSLAKDEIAALRTAPPSQPPPAAAGAPPVVPPARVPAPEQPKIAKATPPVPEKPEHVAAAPPAPAPAPTAGPDEPCRVGLIELAADQFQTCVDKMAGRGLSPETIAAYSSGGRFTVVAALQGPASRSASVLVPRSQRLNKFTEMTRKRLRPDAVSILNDGARILFSEIWVPRREPYEARVFNTKEEYQTVSRVHQNDGFMIRDLVPFRGGKELRYSVIWVKEMGADSIGVLELTEAELSQRNQTLAQQGYRVARISAYDAEGGRRYAAVWQRPAAGGSAWQVRLTPESLLKTHAEMIARGFHIHHVSATGTELSAVWWK